MTNKVIAPPKIPTIFGMLIDEDLDEEVGEDVGEDARGNTEIEY